MSLVPIFCTRCHVPLGLTDGTRLLCGQGVFRRAVELHCGRCGKPRIWQPGPTVRRHSALAR